MHSVNARGRLDRLPVARFHYRMLGLIGGSMFLNAFEIYLQGGVLAALLARFVMGIGLGAEIVVGYVTLTELVPPGGLTREQAFDQSVGR
jgi:hypothetical protein